MTTEIDQKIQEINQKIQGNNGAAVSSDGRLHSSPSDSHKIGTSDVGKSSRGGSTKGRGKYRDAEDMNQQHQKTDTSILTSENHENKSSEINLKNNRDSEENSEDSEFKEIQEKKMSVIPDIQCLPPVV